MGYVVLVYCSTYRSWALSLPNVVHSVVDDFPFIFAFNSFYCMLWKLDLCNGNSASITAPLKIKFRFTVHSHTYTHTHCTIWIKIRCYGKCNASHRCRCLFVASNPSLLLFVQRNEWMNVCRINCRCCYHFLRSFAIVVRRINTNFCIFEYDSVKLATQWNDALSKLLFWVQQIFVHNFHRNHIWLNSQCEII